VIEAAAARRWAVAAALTAVLFASGCGPSFAPPYHLAFSLDAASPRQCRQLSLNNSIQFDPWGNAHGCDLRQGRSVPHPLSSIISSALH